MFFLSRENKFETVLRFVQPTRSSRSSWHLPPPPGPPAGHPTTDQWCDFCQTCLRIFSKSITVVHLQVSSKKAAAKIEVMVDEDGNLVSGDVVLV